ncbi:zinc finger protein 385B [Eutrema salsugineum]|uniref:zinc finger protein 385B n=1 Tax=Eutrema salsugineum TaxID=72664 RepID=UPI000CED1533|nr:zinc finger protein 385B [Eutrema salsugineum]
MEFRYRAVDSDRPPPTTETAPSQSLNPNFSFLSSRPIPGCNSEDHVQKAIQREIEKEQIRQEIIAAETARRRELIAEVVQEMAIEREMAIRRVTETTKGISLEEKLTMLINQKKLANQNQNNNILFGQKCTCNDPMMYTSPYSLVTSPMTQFPPLQTNGATETPVLDSNKEKIVLDRPDLIGAKRKEDVVGLPEKESFQRKKLKSEERAMEMKDASVETGEIVSSKELDNGKQVGSKPKRKYKFWCDVCSVGAFSQTVMRNHELGKKHKAAIEKQEEPPETAASTSENVKGQKVGSKETGKKTEGEEKKLVIIRCETCNILTNSEKMMESHKLGKKHKAKLEKKLNKPQGTDLDTNVIEVPVRSLNADQ